MTLPRLLFLCLLTIGSVSADYTYTIFNTLNPTGTPLTIASVDLAAPVYFIIHGWKETGTQPWVVQMTNAYLLLVPKPNVVVFNWAPDSQIANYHVVSTAVAQAGRALGQKILSVTSITITTTRLIGFSLGAHVAGVAGRVLIAAAPANLLQMIVGLDAPLLAFGLDANRLSKDDAKFVQVFHTSSFGRLDNYGTVDVYFNNKYSIWGVYQLNCPVNAGVNTLATINPEIVDECNHLRSVAYWIESIPANIPVANQFLAVLCSCWVNQVNTCVTPGVQMGQNLLIATAPGKYCLKTNGVTPFGKGAAGII